MALTMGTSQTRSNTVDNRVSLGNTGLNPTDNYFSYLALCIRAPHKQGPVDTRVSLGNTGLNPTDNYCSYVALSIRAPHKQGPLDTMGLSGYHRTKLNKNQKIFLALTTGTS
jgi:hypothetical protein